MSRKLSALSTPQKNVVNTIATYLTAHGLVDHLKKQGFADADQIVSNILDSFTPKQTQIIRALNKEIKATKLAFAKNFEEEENGSSK